MPPETITATRPQPVAAATDVLVAVSLDCRLTAQQLASLTNEQTRDLFAAIKTVAALTEAARKNSPNRT